MASSYSFPVTDSQVGSQFVQQYYHVLQHQPEFAHRFYTDSSTMIRVDGESTEIATAISQIRTLFQSLHFNAIETKTINSVKSSTNGVIVTVSGSVKSDSFGWRKFVQTFFLDPHGNGYVVTNDIFHFVDQKDLLSIISIKDPLEIHYIKRKHDETVEDFMIRFIKETMNIPEADDPMKISGFIHGVRNDELFEMLYANVPKTLEDMIDRVKGFVRGQNALDSLDDTDTRHSTRSWMEQTISFPILPADKFLDGPFVISARIAGRLVHRIHVDDASASEIMYESCFNQLDDDMRRKMTDDAVPIVNPLVRIVEEMVTPIGRIRLPVVIGEGGRSRSLEMTFSVVRADSSPNIIIGRMGIRDLRAVVSLVHGAMKFPTPSGIATILSKREHIVEQVEELNTDDSD